MSTEREQWADLTRAIEAADGPRFAPVDPATIEALRAAFDCPTWFEELLRAGYPGTALNIEHGAFFPPVAELIKFRDEDPAWPRAWLPLEFSDGHCVRFIRSDAQNHRGLWEYFRDGAEPESVHTPPTTPVWDDLGDFASALQILFVETRDANYVVREGQRWLGPDATTRVKTSLGQSRASRAFEFFRVSTVEGVRAAWDGDRRTALVAMAVTGFFTLLAAAFLVMPRGWTFSLAVGALPAGLLAYCTNSWLRSRERLRSLQTG